MEVDAEEEVVDSNDESTELQVFTQIPSQPNAKTKRILPSEEDSNDDSTVEVLTQVPSDEQYIIKSQIMVKKNKKTVHFNLDASYALNFFLVYINQK